MIGTVSCDGSNEISLAYDAYGNISAASPSTGLGDALARLVYAALIVPQQYRGYAVAPVAGSIGYYLGSRFYVPELGRFLNADVYEDTGSGVVGTNMYAYCNNDPVMFVDPEGTKGMTLKDKINALVGLVLFYAFCNKHGKNIYNYIPEGYEVVYSKWSYYPFNIPKGVASILSTLVKYGTSSLFTAAITALTGSVGGVITSILIEHAFNTIPDLDKAFTVVPGKYAYGNFIYTIQHKTTGRAISFYVKSVIYLGSEHSYLEFFVYGRL